MAWTKYSNVARNRQGGVIANVKIIVDYNASAANRGAALLEIKDWSKGTGDTISINASTNADDFTITEGTNFTAETSDKVTAENIASAIGGNSNYEARATATGHGGNPYVSIVYTNGHIDGLTSGDSNAWQFYSASKSSTGIPKLASDDSGTIKYQPIFTDSNGEFQFFIDGPADIDIEASKSGQTFNDTYTKDITVSSNVSSSGEAIQLVDSANNIIIDTSSGDIDAKGNSLINLLDLIISDTNDDIKLRKDGSGNFEIYNNTDGNSILKIDENTAKALLQGDLDLGNGNIDDIASIDGGGDAIISNDDIDLNSNSLKNVSTPITTPDTNNLETLEEAGYEKGDYLWLVTWTPARDDYVQTTSTTYTSFYDYIHYQLPLEDYFNSDSTIYWMYKTEINPGADESVSVRLQDTKNGNTILERTGISGGIHFISLGPSQYEPPSLTSAMGIVIELKTSPGDTDSTDARGTVVMGVKI